MGYCAEFGYSMLNGISIRRGLKNLGSLGPAPLDGGVAEPLITRPSSPPHVGWQCRIWSLSCCSNSTIKRYDHTLGDPSENWALPWPFSVIKSDVDRSGPMTPYLWGGEVWDCTAVNRLVSVTSWLAWAVTISQRPSMTGGHDQTTTNTALCLESDTAYQQSKTHK